MMSSQMDAVGFPGRAASYATKHAVDGLTRALAVEWARRDPRQRGRSNVRAHPADRAMLAAPTFLAEVVERLPAGQLAHVDDVARAVRYLACGASAGVTGHILRVDGGWTAW